MNHCIRSFASGLVATSLLMTTAGPALAAPTKDECVEAHGRGQDLREEGRLTRARQAFLTCSQPTCPSLVQSDCSRFVEELGRILPSVTFVARDTKATDLPNTAVYLDEQLVASRLDDGKSYDVDPGKHAVRFVHDGKEVSMRVVVTQGEKGRNVIATFADAAGGEPAQTGSGTRPSSAGEPPSAPPEPSRPVFPLVLAGAGAVTLGIGVVLLAVGLGKVPSNCNNSTKECAAPPFDKAFDDAHSGVAMANAGVVLGIAGGAIAATGLIWYFAQAPQAKIRTGKGFSPWVAPGTGGVSFSGAF